MGTVCRSIPRFSAKAAASSKEPSLEYREGMARRVDMVGPEGVDGHGDHQSRVDTAREADHGVDEAVLGQIVTGAEDEGGVHLGIGVESRGRRRCRAGAGPRGEMC